MADIIRVLGQSAPAATSLVALYTVPGATSATISTVHVCNRGAQGTFRISIAIAGAVDANAQYLYRDLPIAANDSFALTLGITLAATDVIRVFASSSDFTFQAFGVEIT